MTTNLFQSRRQALGLLAGAVAAGLPLSVDAQARRQHQQADLEAFPGLDALIEQARQDWRVPGFSFAILKDGAVHHSKGYGNLQLGRAAAVTPATAFGLASVSKMVTAATVAIGVDKGLVSWDAPVTNWLPDFRMSGGSAWQGVSLRDMLSHRTGMPRHDLLWYNNEGLTRELLLHHLPHLAVTAPLREKYQYNNIMVILAAHALEKAAGTTWEAFAREHLLTPLGMNRTVFSPATLRNDPNRCSGHRLDAARRPEPIPLRPQDAVGPAGSLWSTVEDFSRFVQMQLDRGRWGNRQIISEAGIAAMWAPTISTEPPGSTSTDTGGYGLGWRIDTYRGMKRIAHGGNLNGFSTRVTLFPDQNIGMIAFANMRGNSMPGLVSLDVMDRLMGLEPQNNSAASLARRNATEARADAAAPPVPPASSAPPSQPLSAYAGIYVDPGYGRISVAATPGGLHASYNSMIMALDHKDADVFEARPLGIDDGDLAGLKFQFGAPGLPASVSIKMDEDAPDVVFVRT